MLFVSADDELPPATEQYEADRTKGNLTKERRSTKVAKVIIAHQHQ
jgi:hypothetical protein